jgi:hypothetical protein
LPARPNATARPREAIAHCHGQQRREVRRVALMVGRPRIEDDRTPVRIVRPIFVIGIGY